MISPPPRSPLFPYTTLFRSPDSAPNLRSSAEFSLSPQLKSSTLAARIMINWIAIFIVHLQQLKLMGGDDSTRRRSEEHTSELQSRPHLVCRLLLEKKKRTTG